ncbi:ATP-binding protein [Paenisporosarcina sp. FSL H8-0542]|uniref:ATP-binding protein n=1 Tax=Paenisporosarcina sp. FSL H8-0542 TaxID=2921401 RepID=UPI00315AD6FD
MEIITKDLLINFLFILLPLLLLQMFYLLKFVYRIEKMKENLFTVLSLFSIFLCMLFPFPVGDGLIWDLRRIPFVIGVLYGGPKNGFLLLIFVIVARYFMLGVNDGFYITIITFTLLAVTVSFVSRYYLKMTLEQKVLTSSSLVLLSTVITFIVVSLFFNVIVSVNMWLQFFFITFLGTVIVTLLIEVIRMNSDLLEKLMKAEKLEVVSHLAASISHEVRNPLTTCKGFLQLSYDEERSPEIKQYLGTALQELDRASDIINDYLTFAKPVPDKVEKVFVNEAVQNVLNILTPLANMQDVQIFYHPDQSGHANISGDRKKLEQSLINIVKNGIESMQKGGELEIYTVVEYPKVRIAISDEGKGMTQQQINRLGEPYFTMKDNGTGLGMMVSFSLIKGMGGEIHVESELGNFTIFTIEFPMVT